MREILFRGKNLESEKWVYGDLMENTYIFGKNDLYCLDSYEVDKETIGQYIGVKDSCENRIFDGDILLIDGGIGVIIWDSHSMRWGLESPGSCAVDFPMKDDYKQSKIIGNIHDNSNIIKQ